MKLESLLHNQHYCVAVSEHGVGSFTYQTLKGDDIVRSWLNLKSDGFLVGSYPDLPESSKWTGVELPDGEWIIVREHKGHIVPDVFKCFPVAEKTRKRVSKLEHVKPEITVVTDDDGTPHSDDFGLLAALEIGAAEAGKIILRNNLG